MSSEREIIVELSFSRYTIVPNDNGEDAEREFAGILFYHRFYDYTLYSGTSLLLSKPLNSRNLYNKDTILCPSIVL